MHVALVMNSASGMKILRLDLIRFLQSLRHRVTAVCPSDSAAWANFEPIGLHHENWKVSRDGMNPIREVLSILRLRRLLTRIQPDVILCFTPKAVLLGSLAARRLPQSNVFSILTGLGFLFGRDGHLPKLLAPMIHTLFRHALKRNRLVFFQNPDDLELFVSRRIVPRNQTHRIFGSGVDTRRFVPRIPREPQDNTVFLMISRLICAKGVLEYIEAARILKHEGRPAKFRLLGPFDKHPTAVDPAAVSTATRSGVIEYCGTTDDVRPYIRDADVFVLPSYYGEGTPRSSLEAMAMGKPIVTTDSPGCRETVVQGRNGYLVPIRDPIALANAMRELIGNRERIQSMGLRSRGIAEDLYDVQKVNSDLWREISRTLK